MAIRILVDTPEEKEAILRESECAWDWAEEGNLIPEDNITARIHLNPDMIEVLGTSVETGK